MPVKKAAIKSIRQTKKRTIRNRKISDGLKYLARKIKKAFDQNKLEEAEKLFREYTKAVDKAVKNKILKKNTGSRRKSRTALGINKLKKSGSDSADKKVK